MSHSAIGPRFRLQGGCGCCEWRPRGLTLTSANGSGRALPTRPCALCIRAHLRYSTTSIGGSYAGSGGMFLWLWLGRVGVALDGPGWIEGRPQTHPGIARRVESDLTHRRGLLGRAEPAEEQHENAQYCVEEDQPNAQPFLRGAGWVVLSSDHQAAIEADTDHDRYRDVLEREDRSIGSVEAEQPLERRGAVR